MKKSCFLSILISLFLVLSLSIVSCTATTDSDDLVQDGGTGQTSGETGSGAAEGTGTSTGTSGTGTSGTAGGTDSSSSGAVTTSEAFSKSSFSVRLEIKGGLAACVDWSLLAYPSGETVKSESAVVAGGTVSFSGSIDEGTYLVRCDFYGDGEKTMRLNTYSEIVCISAGKRSSAAREIYLNEIFTITADLGGGTIAQSSLVQSIPSQYFRKSQTIVLPTLEKQGEYFNGWYKSADFSGEAVTEIPSGSTGNVSLWAKWETLPKYTISYDLDGGDWAEDYTAPATFTEKDAVSLPDASMVKKQGYGFTSWHEISSDGTATEETTSQIALGTAENKTFRASWLEGAVSYTVQHLWQNTEDDGYTLHETETLSGKTGTQTAAATKDYEGFDAQTVTQQTVLSDESTVVEIKYDRKTVTISFDSDCGSAVESISGRYGATYTKPENPTKTGYAFASWSPELPDTLVNLSVKANWTANTNTPYKVEHYKQPVSGSETISDYALSDTDNETGTTAQSTAATAKLYAGFTTKTFEQVAIAPDGSTVVKIYYDRKTITYTFGANGGSWADGSTANKTISGLYGATVTAPENPARTGCTFTAWSTEVGSTFAAEDKTFTARWTANALGVTVTLESVSTDASLSITENGGTLTATSGFAIYTWKIDGSVAQSETGNTYTPSTDSLEAGYHNITLIVTDSNGGIWSATAVITVQK